MYLSLHMSQVIKYMRFSLLQEKCLLIKYVLPVNVNINFTSATKCCLQMSQELHCDLIFAWLLTDFE